MVIRLEKSKQTLGLDCTLTCGRAEFDDLTPELIVRSALSLAQTGDLLTKVIRGDGEGINLYLPADFDPKLYLPQEPLTWLEEIAQLVLDFWVHRAKGIIEQGSKPPPFSTGEFRGFIATKEFRFEPHPTSDPQLLVNALNALSETRKAVLRKVKRSGEKALLWAPIELTDEELDFGVAYASDAERVGEAVRRSVARLGRPVNLHDISEEIEFDKTLKPIGKTKLFSIISDVAKEKIDAGDGTRRKRIKRRIYWIGQINGKAYYDTADKPEAHNYIRVRHLNSIWSSLSAEKRLSTLSTSSVQSIIIGRAKLIATEIKTVSDELDDLIGNKHINSQTRYEAKELRRVIRKITNNVDSWLNSNLDGRCKLPEQVNTATAGWTAAELLDFFKRLNSRFKRISDHNSLISLLKENIRRIPNPNFVYRFSNDTNAASEYLYDQTDALLYTAKEWGGFECCSQAMIADNELERLRDVRFVLPALNAKSFNARFAGVACLAFLRSDEGNKVLLHTAMHDSDAGVRRSALWSYYFAGGKNPQELLHDRAVNDSHIKVRQFAEKLIKVNAIDLWVL